MSSPLHPDLKRVVEKQLSVLDGWIAQYLELVIEHRAALADWEQKLSNVEAERNVLTGILQGDASPLRHEPQ